MIRGLTRIERWSPWMATIEGLRHDPLRCTGLAPMQHSETLGGDAVGYVPELACARRKYFLPLCGGFNRSTQHTVRSSRQGFCVFQLSVSCSTPQWLRRAKNSLLSNTAIWTNKR